MKKNYEMLAIYMIIMAAALATAHFEYHVDFTDKNFLPVLMPWLLILAASVSVYQYIYRKQLLVNLKGRGHYGIYLITSIPVLALAIHAITSQIQSNSFSPVLLIATLLIGIAEEGMYTGILLKGFLHKDTYNKSIFTTALLFSLVHSMDILTGQSAAESLIQLLITFISGLYFGTVYLCVKKIPLLVLQHWMWNYVIFSGIIRNHTLYNTPLILTAVLSLVFSAWLLHKFRLRHI